MSGSAWYEHKPVERYEGSKLHVAYSSSYMVVTRPRLTGGDLL